MNIATLLKIFYLDIRGKLVLVLKSLKIKVFENGDTINKLFTNPGYSVRTCKYEALTFCTALASSGRTKRSGFVFPCTDRVTPLLNSKCKSDKC